MPWELLAFVVIYVPLAALSVVALTNYRYWDELEVEFMVWYR